jgi:phospholipid/cholesterol/gamma-HCH transport system ATP-binding protein
MIEIRNIKKSIGGQEVLKGVNLNIPDNELVAVIGKSGGGKTVFLKHLIGLLTPDEGHVLINGTSICCLSSKELDEQRNQFGVLFQGGALFDSLSVFRNIAFPLREKTKMNEDEIRKRVLEALDDVGLEGFGNKFPAELSGGMKKRTALARALITEPKIVLFDEPTTGLDPIIVNSIHSLITTTHKKYGYTGIIISHEIPEIFDVADKVAMLHEGVILEFGTVDEIKASTNPIVREFVSGGRECPLAP